MYKEPIQGELIEPEQAIAIADKPGMLAKCDRGELAMVAENLYEEMPPELKTQQMLSGLLHQANGGKVAELEAMAREIIQYFHLAQRTNTQITVAPRQHTEIAPNFFHDYRKDFRQSHTNNHHSSSTTINNYFVQGDYVGGDYNAGDPQGSWFSGYLTPPSQSNINVTVSPNISTASLSRSDANAESYSDGDGRGWLLIPFALIAIIIGAAASGD